MQKIFIYVEKNLKINMLMVKHCEANPIRDEEGGQKGPPTSFSLITSTNVGISPQNLLTFSFHLFSTLI